MKNRKDQKVKTRVRKEHKGDRKDVRQGWGKKYNQWVGERMRGALAEYRETVERGLKANVRFLARAWNIPRATLQRRISGDITGTDHASGRKPILPEAAEKEQGLSYPLRRPQ